MINKQEYTQEKKAKESTFDSTFLSDQEKKVGQRIKDVIGEEPVKAFARRCGVPDSSLRDYTSDRKKPGVDALIAIAAAAGVTVDWLATGKGIKYTRDLKQAQERLNGAPPAVVPDLPLNLEPYRKRLDALLNYLAQIDEEEDRSRIIDDFVLRAHDKIELVELKHVVNEMRATYNKKKDC